MWRLNRFEAHAAGHRLTVFTALALGTLVLGACGPDDPPTPEPPPLAEGIYGPLGTIRPDATAEQLAAFERGRDFGSLRFQPSTGLGPVFNVSFCGACHEKPVFGGGAPRYRDFFLQASLLPDGSYIEPPGAGILHFYGIPEDNLRPGRGGNWNIQARRSGIPFFGVGLIAEIDEAAILANADPDDRDGDGISGRPNWDDTFVGRFGRKAQTVSSEGFIRGPLNNHLGITSDPLTDAQRAALPVDSSAAAREAIAAKSDLRTRVQGQAAPPSEPLTDDDDVPDPELTGDQLFDIVSFAMLLAAPEPSPPTVESEAGRVVFDEIGCTSCHVPYLESPRGAIPLWSDLLLHDMGEALADGIEMGVADAAEFRTQPLWGIAAVAPYLHDGRADTLDEAILWHGGEALASRDAYAASTQEDRDNVIAFLESLGGLEQRSDGMLPPNAPIPAVGTFGGPGEPLGDDEDMWLEGRRLFDRDMFVGEGLGPGFNGDSCRACHFEGQIGGAGPIGVNVMRHGTWADDLFVAPSGGTILTKLMIPGMDRLEAGDDINVYEPRQTPHVLGLALIEAIATDTIVALEDPDDADGDGISGRVHWIDETRIGRLGWKAQVPNVREFARDALGAEMGMTVPQEDGFTFGAFADADDALDPEISVEDLDALSLYMRRLGPPPAPGPEHAAGAALFEEVGCGSCHVPSLPSELGPVRLYSDLLLHDVAPESFLGIDDGAATGREFRTPPLWGLSASAPYMHDGRAETAEQAVMVHAGEATVSVAAFEALTPADRATLLGFLEAL